MADYYTILTNTGKQKLADAIATETSIDFTDIAIGDGGGSVYSPTEAQTELVNEQYRAQINNIYADPQNTDRVIIEAMIPSAVGGWHIREAGIFDVDGDMIAVAKFPETYKPVLAEGSGKDVYIKIVLVVGNATAVTLQVNAEAVLATRQYVLDMDALHEAKSNPHPQYLTQPEGDALYDPLGIAAAQRATHEATEDPHPQYLKQSESDVLYDPLGSAAAQRATHEATEDPHPQYKPAKTTLYFFGQI